MSHWFEDRWFDFLDWLLDFARISHVRICLTDETDPQTYWNMNGSRWESDGWFAAKIGKHNLILWEGG